ncbi:Halomucin, partial [Durusdinium trenchii]
NLGDAAGSGESEPDDGASDSDASNGPSNVSTAESEGCPGKSSLNVGSSKNSKPASPLAKLARGKSTMNLHPDGSESETLELPGLGSEASGSDKDQEMGDAEDTDCDGELLDERPSPKSFGSGNDGDTFEEAMHEGSTSAHKAALAAPSSQSTMTTPACKQPQFWGFPMAPKESDKNKKKVKKNKASSGKGKASFKHTAPKKGALVGPRPSGTVYAGYDLTPVPIEARPDLSRSNQGSHSYTLNFGGVVEVLLQKEAYFVKKVGPKGTGPTGQVSWAKNGGPKAAFKIAVERAGLERSASV